MFQRFNILALLLVFLLAATPALAAAPGGGQRTLGGGQGDVTKITAESMVYDSSKRLVTFRTKVRVVQPDFTMTSDTLDLHLSSSGSQGAASGASAALSPDMEGGQVEKIIARTNVVIRLPDGRNATCQKATYTVHDEMLLMEGSPVLREEGNVLSADVIRFYLKESRSTAHGNVKVDFTSKSNGQSNGQNGGQSGQTSGQGNVQNNGQAGAQPSGAAGPTPQ